MRAGNLRARQDSLRKISGLMRRYQPGSCTMPRPASGCRKWLCRFGTHILEFYRTTIRIAATTCGRREEVDGTTERVRRDDRAGGGNELLLGAGFRADVRARSRRGDGDQRRQPLQRLWRQAVIVSAGLRLLPGADGAGPCCAAREAAAGFGGPGIF